MIIEIQHLPSSGASFSYSEPVKRFAVLSELTASGQGRFADPVVINLTIVPERDMFLVKGTVAATVQLSCSRCLADYQSRLSRKFTLRFSKEIPDDLHRGDDEEVELTAEKIGLIYFEGEEIHLRDAVEEQLVMALPYKPLCKDDCKGLCPKCGADLNVEPCSCTADRSMNPFEVLKHRQWPKGEEE